MKAYSVSQITGYIKNIIENDFLLKDVYVEAEISNFKAHSSGHFYFTLKDSSAEIKCVMFRSNVSDIKFMPENGMSVIVRGYISIYEKTGNYQLYVTEMEQGGIGELYIAFEKLKARLQKAGVFDNKYKKPIPSMPETVAVITSSTGAAVRDIINVAGRRNPNVEIVVVPCLVQGAGAGEDIVKKLDAVNRWGGADVIILGRGGGSIEDLWAFNEEIVARAIFNSEIPVISAVGHETDFTIADFIADMRAPTPSAAAEIAVPEGNQISRNIDNMYKRMCKNIALKLNNCMSRYRLAVSVHNFSRFEDRVGDSEIYLSELYEKMTKAVNDKVNNKSLLFKNYVDSIENRSPLNILKKGYSLVYNDKGEIVKDSCSLNTGDSIDVIFDKGRIKAEVVSMEYEKAVCDEQKEKL